MSVLVSVCIDYDQGMWQRKPWHKLAGNVWGVTLTVMPTLGGHIPLFAGQEALVAIPRDTAAVHVRP